MQNDRIARGRPGVSSTKKYVILREDTTISQSGQSWITAWALEAFPY